MNDIFTIFSNELKYQILYRKFLKYKLDCHEITTILKGLKNLGIHYIPSFVNVYDLLKGYSLVDLLQLRVKYALDTKKLCRSYNKFLKRYYRYILLKEPICFDDISISADELFSSNNAVALKFILENIGIPYYIKHKFPFDFYLDIKGNIYENQE